MPPTPPRDLEDLKALYTQLVNAVQSQGMPLEEAERRLAGLAVFDAFGARWQITANGEYARQESQTAPVVLVDESQYIPPPSAGGGMPSMQPPAPGRPAAPAPGPASGPGGMFGGFGGGAGFGNGGGMSSVGDAPAREGLNALWSKHKKTIIVVVAGVALLAVAMQGKPAPSGTPGQIPAGTTAASPAATASAGDSTMPMDGSGGTSAAPQAQGPAAADVARVISQLTSGQTTAVAAVVASPGDAAAVAVHTAEYVGFTKMGYTMSPGAVTGTGSSFSCQIQLLDGSRRQVGTATAVLVQSGGTWKVQSFPEFAVG